MIKQSRSIKSNREVLRNAGLVLVMLLLTFGFLLARGIVHVKAPDFARVKAAVTAQADAGTMTPADEAALRKNYGFNARDLEDFVYFAPKSAMDASELLVLKVRDEGALESYRKTVEARRTTRIDTFKNYRPEEAQILERSTLKVQGKYLIFLSARDLSPVQAAVDSSFR